jgi:signal peptidase I
MHSQLVVVGFAFAFTFACLLRAVVEPRVVTRGSMEPTLHPGDRVLAFKTRGSSRPAKTGDIVMLREPQRADRPRLHSRPRELIKRVVAEEHDIVLIAHGVVFVNGLPTWVGTNAPNLSFGPCEVPEGSLFVLGEDLAVSRDSREFGPVMRSLAVGRIFAVYWPANRIRLLRSPVHVSK